MSTAVLPSRNRIATNHSSRLVIRCTNPNNDRLVGMIPNGLFGPPVATAHHSPTVRSVYGQVGAAIRQMLGRIRESDDCPVEVVRVTRVDGRLYVVDATIAPVKWQAIAGHELFAVLAGEKPEVCAAPQQMLLNPNICNEDSRTLILSGM